MFNKLTIKTRLFALIAFMAATMVSLSALSLYALNKTNQGLQTVYFDRTIPTADLGEIKFNLLHIRTALVTIFSFPDDTANQQKKIEEDVTNINRLWDGYIVTFLTPEEKVLAEKFINERQHFMEELNKLSQLQNSTKKEEAKDFYFGNVRAAFTPLIKTSDDLVKLQMDVAKQEYERAQDGYQSFLITSIALLFAGLTLSILLGVFIVRRLMAELGTEPNEVADLVTQVAQGKLDNVITLQPNDTNSVLANIRKMQYSINDFVSAQDALAKKHAEGWIFEKMDANRFPGTFGRMANEINTLVATHVAVKMQVVEVVSKYAKGDFSVDMDRLYGDKAKVTAAVDSVKAALLAVSGEIKTIVAAGVNGDFSHRVNVDDFESVFKDILTDLNRLMETCDLGFGDIERVAKALAQGDLTQTISKEYPGTFGQVNVAIDGTVENLKNMIIEIKEASESISTAAKEIAAGNNDLSHRTEEQAASLEQTAASMQELTSTVQHNSENAKHANQLAFSATDLASKGVHVVDQVVETMESIHSSSRKVVDIISVIDGIAFQTNILALNAAVEAARAGEQGRGFAVVAGEVRNLAQRAATAAAEIKALIGDSVDQIEVGTRLVTNAGKTMEEIVTSIRGVTGIMSEIAAAAVEQTSGIEQVNLAIGQMDDVTQQNAALVEQAAASAESLEEQTHNLGDTIGKFKVDNQRSGRQSSERATTSKNTSFASKPSAPLKTYQQQAAPVVTTSTINFDEVLEKHSAWKVKLRSAITSKEELDVATISKDNCCDFGKWLYGDAKAQLGHRASFSECVAKHAAFHIEAGKVAVAINAKRFQEAEAMLGGESSFNNASKEVGIAVIRLKKDVDTPTAKAKPQVQVQTAINSEWEEF